MIDARREEVFLQEFEQNLVPTALPKPVVLPGYNPGEGPFVFCGDGSEKAKKYFDNGKNIFVPEAKPLAQNMSALAEKFFAEKKFEDVAYFEPFYLKEFYTGK
jgi:tRNA threonylcarbamoyladenosine biosynthesis protein TsaB